MTIKTSSSNNAKKDGNILPVATATGTDDFSYGATAVGIPLGDDDEENKKYGYALYQQETDNNNNNKYWGRFNDPQVTVLPTNGRCVFRFVGDDEEPLLLPVANARLDDRQIRHQFIRRVYLILIGQLFVTFGVCAIMTLNETVRYVVLYTPVVGLALWGSFGISIVLLFCLSSFKRSYPTNMILLLLFTIAMSYSVGVTTALYAEMGAADSILEAMFITLTVFVLLTLYTLQSKHDFSFMRAGLGMSLWILILWGFFAAIFGVQTGFLYSLIGSIVFSGFIIYDTYMLAEKHDPRDYVMAAIELYLDIINLFLLILQSLSSNNNG